MAKRHLPEYKEEPYQTGTINVNITAIPTNNLYYVGIDLKGWQLEDIAALKEVVQRGESRKLIPEEENTVEAL